MNRIIILFIGIVLFASCTSKKQLTYLQDINRAQEAEFYAKQKGEYKIQPQDVLYIRLLSMNEEVNALYNIGYGSQSQQMFQNESGIYLNGFVVEEDGNIELPIIGKVNVLNKNLDEAKKSVREAATVYLKNPTIIVKLLSFKFTVLGEVSRPGMYKNYNNQLTVLEAIGMAGDISDHGDRRNILVLRPTKEGTKTFRIDLTKKDILTSDAYFLLPNDMVYVEPKNSKTFQMNVPNISLMFTTISTLILVLNFMNK